MAASLKTLLEGIYSSVLEARRYVSAQHFEVFRSYFEKKIIDDPVTGRTQVYVPRLISIATSKIEGGRETFDVTDAPQMTLIPLSTLAIETLEIEFEAKLTNLNMFQDAGEDDDEDEGGGPEDTLDGNGDYEDAGFISRTYEELRHVADDINVMIKGESLDSAASPAKVKITFKLTDPPEGVSLIQEQLLDYLRD